MPLLVLLVVSVAALDSANPSTVFPALLYALGVNARRDVAAFTAGVFGTSFVGGLVLVFGPGHALLSVVSHPSPGLVHAIETGVGLVLLAAAAFLWATRARVRRRLEHQKTRAAGSAFALGVAIMATELPTAFPYFGALIAITEGARSSWTQFLLVLTYNIVFVAPLLVLLAVITFAGEQGARVAANLRQRMIRHAPVLFPLALALVGIVLVVLGVIGDRWKL
jgi:cytochrome c biogenesis protein CcdA